MVENDNHGVIQEGLAEDTDIQQLVDVDLLEDGEDSHRIDGWMEDGGTVRGTLPDMRVPKRRMSMGSISY